MEYSRQTVSNGLPQKIFNRIFSPNTLGLEDQTTLVGTNEVFLLP